MTLERATTPTTGDGRPASRTVREAAIMDRLAERVEGSSPWPAFEAVDVAAAARGLGCEALCVERHDDLVRILADVLPGLAGRRDPLLVEVVVEPDPEFAP